MNTKLATLGPLAVSVLAVGLSGASLLYTVTHDSARDRERVGVKVELDNDRAAQLHETLSGGVRVADLTFDVTLSNDGAVTLSITSLETESKIGLLDIGFDDSRQFTDIRGESVFLPLALQPGSAATVVIHMDAILSPAVIAKVRKSDRDSADADKLSQRSLREVLRERTRDEVISTESEMWEGTVVTALTARGNHAIGAFRAFKRR